MITQNFRYYCFMISYHSAIRRTIGSLAKETVTIGKKKEATRCPNWLLVGQRISNPLYPY